MLLLYTPQISIYLLSGIGKLSFLSVQEASHIHDVYLVMRTSVALGIILAIGLWLMRRFIDFKTVKIAFRMSLLLFLLLPIFPLAFEAMHTIMFPQGNWQFPADSWLISHYSAWFFFGVAFFWFAQTSVVLALLIRNTFNLKAKS